MEFIQAKTMITRTKSGEWFGTDYNMNIYKGCCHGCIYCDSRSSCYGIVDFDQVRAKENALQMIRDELRRKVKRGVVATGAMSDPYNPFEQTLNLTGHALELIDAFEFGAAIATKSTLLLRDLEILNCIKEHSPVICKITITAADDHLGKLLEPGAALSSERFAMLAKLAEYNIFSGILLMPVLPFLEDSEENVLAIVKLAKEAGSRFIYPAFGMTLRENQRNWYYQKLSELFPGQNLVERYQKQYGYRYTCTSPKASSLWKVFRDECEKLGILYQMKDIISAYKRNYRDAQLSLFDLFPPEV